MSKEENINKNIDLKNYDDSNDLTLKELNFGLWLSENRKKLRQLLTIVLIIISVGLFVFSAYNYFIYFKSTRNNIQLAGSVPQSPRRIVANLKIAPLQIFPGFNHSDLAVKLSNPNNKFMANFKYCFTQATRNLICKSAYIMPSETKYIIALAQILNSSSENIHFKIKNIVWQRINAHKIPNWNNYVSSHLNFLVIGLKFNSARNSGLSQKIGLNSLTFSIKNESPYGYSEVPLNLLFFNGESLVGVNRYFLENFLSGEKRKVKIVWSGNLSMVNKTEIQPDINLISNSVYLPYKGIISD